MLFRYQAGDNLEVEIEAASVKEAIKQLSEVGELLSDKHCGKCKSPNIRPRHRVAKDNDYYELYCCDCGAALSFGQHKTKGTMWPKRRNEDDTKKPNNGWERYGVADPEPARFVPAETPAVQQPPKESPPVQQNMLEPEGGWQGATNRAADWLKNAADHLELESRYDKCRARGFPENYLSSLSAAYQARKESLNGQDAAVSRVRNMLGASGWDDTKIVEYISAEKAKSQDWEANIEKYVRGLTK
jgi:hypothetical protein